MPVVRVAKDMVGVEKVDLRTESVEETGMVLACSLFPSGVCQHPDRVLAKQKIPLEKNRIGKFIKEHNHEETKLCGV